MAKTILMVEDNDLVVRVYEAVLSGLGHRPVHVRTGAEASRLASELRPDLVIMDIRLPDGSGLDVIRGLKADPKIASIPVIVVSTRVAAGDESRLAELGCAGFVSKPIDVARFSATVQSVLGETAG
jgi:two-component system cell cycle response regulator DivK